MRIGILGAGLSGVSLAFFLQDSENISSISILEKEMEYGGLCRSFPFHDIHYDIGPHILFSKDRSVMQLVIDFLSGNVHTIRRSNQIYHKCRYIKYPFENDLYHLPDEDRAYCLNTFLNNPYEKFRPANMMQFFLTTFGEGITNLYLRPYNEKIWKFDPCFMDTQMVERIPKPPAEDIIKSAQGICTEGYVHQLNFQYPKTGGIASLVDGFAVRHNDKISLRTGFDIRHIDRDNGTWKVTSAKGETLVFDRLVSTIPIPELAMSLVHLLPDRILSATGELKSNSIIICPMRLEKDFLGANFVITCADSSIIFHRLSKLDFLYDRQTAGDGSVTVVAEITYRKNDTIDAMTDDRIAQQVIDGLLKMQLINNPQECLDIIVKRFEYSYVIYDLNHRNNVDTIKHYYEHTLGIWLAGRFGEYEYLNMDSIVKRMLEKSIEIKKSLFIERMPE